jgi:glucose-1-phosphatase
MIKTLVFDFGNVVGFFSHRQASERLAAHTDTDVETLHRFLFGGSIEDDYDCGRLSTSAFLDRVREGCGLRCPDEELATAYADIFWPNREVCDLLPTLALRHDLILLSNTNELHARNFLARFAEVLRPFKHLLLSHKLGARKPHPAVFARAQELAGCRPEEIVFIDDMPANVAAARACGWHGIVYTGTDDLLRQLAALGVRVPRLE